MKKITRTQLDALEVPFSPLAEQQKIAVRLDAELTAARVLVETLETRLAEIELLPAALLRSAFSQQN
jgi:restriction endonuclease S subunit